jgi:hypothetical protein
MADRNLKRTPQNTRIQLGLACTKRLKAVKYWITKKLREDAPCDLIELNDALIGTLIREMSLAAEEKSTDLKLYYPEAFNASDYKNWTKKVTNYLDARRGKAGVPLSYVICPAKANPDNATNEYTRTLWAALFETPQYVEDNREVYHLFKVLVTKTDGATWFKKVTDGDGRAAHLLLRKHYVGEAHDMRRAASANAKLEALFWKSEAAFPFGEKYLTRMNEAFKGLEGADQPMYMQQKVKFLLKSMRCDDIQLQTTMGIVRDKYLHDFDAACMTLSRTVSSRFALAEPGKSNKRCIGATTTTGRGRSGSGRGGYRSGNRSGHGGTAGRVKVVMNGVDVSDINRNFTGDEWEKLRTCGGVSYIHQRREYLANRSSGRFDGRNGGPGRGGGRGYADRGLYGARSGGRHAIGHQEQPRTIAAATASTSTEIVEYDADTSNVNAPARAPASGEDRGGRAGARFGLVATIDLQPRHPVHAGWRGGLWRRSNRATGLDRLSQRPVQE